MVKSDISRFEVWLVNLNPTKGREINKTRPCVVISPNEMSALSTVIVAPMTTKGFAYPCRVECEFIGKKGLIVASSIVFYSINKRTAFHRIRHHIVHTVEISTLTPFECSYFYTSFYGGDSSSSTQYYTLEDNILC